MIAPAAPRNPERGFTLVELMVSLVLFSLVIAGMLSIGVSMARGFREQQVTVSAEDSSRMAIELIGNALRSASPGVSDHNQIEHLNSASAGNPCLTGAFRVVNSSVAPDELTIVYTPGVVTTTTSAFNSGQLTFNVVNASQFRIGDLVMVTDFTKGHTATINNIAANTITVTGPTCTTGPNWTAAAYGAGSTVIRVLRARFFIAPQDGIPTLFMDADDDGVVYTPEPLAEGIEDLQVVRGFDAGAPGLADVGAAANDDDWFGNHPGDSVVPAGPLRAIKVALIAQATSPTTAPIYTRPATGDRAASGTPDAFRRRIVSTIVELRNQGGSP